MTQVYVRRLFDQYAGRFDAALTVHLDYRGPTILRDAVDGVRAADASARIGSMLDLGCGTGLAGAAFRPIVDRLVGADLSPAMIEQAAAKGLYDRMVAADALQFLTEERERSEKYDLVVAADVFTYVNDLGPIVEATTHILAPNGLFTFTVETHDGDGVKLQQTLRYAHGTGYVRAALAAAGLTALRLAEASIRTEKGKPVPGLVVVAQASTVSDLLARAVA
jgi:predicted TPR repeat methyltransferase